MTHVKQNRIVTIFLFHDDMKFCFDDFPFEHG